ncbi:MAG: PQQ-like beta-propeller repeat protein [Gemmataceae bacterium]|nr:PQQ-like beta-propeller repeat protein [Gemmataceae bacterium]
MIRLLFAFVIPLASLSVAVAADWPQWRGPDRNGISKETGLLKEWPKDGPTLRWKADDIGTGYSTPAIAGGRVYLQTTNGNEESTIALDEKTGKKIWSQAIGKVGKNTGPQYPGTRSTPTVDGDFLYCLSSDGELVCLERDMGKVKWQKNFRKDFEGKVGAWAYSESVLIDGDALVCTPGGSTATLAALNKKTGETIWKAAVKDGDVADYASIMAVETDKVKQYVQFLRGGVVGVDAKTGKVLWRYDRTVDRGANILTPVVLGNRVFTAGSRTGGALVELKVEGEGVEAAEVYFDKSLGASIGGVVLVDGHMYGTTAASLFCAEFATGKVKWTERAVGPASICYADGRLYVRGYSSGDVALVEPSPEGYREKGKFRQPERSKIQCWPHPVVANGGLYLRDQGVLLCYDVAAK